MPRRPVSVSLSRFAFVLLPLIIVALALLLTRVSSPRAAESHGMSMPMAMTAADMKRRLAEWYAVHPAHGASVAAAPVDSFTAAGFRFDRDHNASTVIDTAHITQGDAIKFKWVSGVHTVTSGTGALDPNVGLLFDQSLADATENFSFTFNTPGTFPFFCVFHELSNMKGVVVVSAPLSAPASGDARAPHGLRRATVAESDACGDELPLRARARGACACGSARSAGAPRGGGARSKCAGRRVHCHVGWPRCQRRDGTGRRVPRATDRAGEEREPEGVGGEVGGGRIALGIRWNTLSRRASATRMGPGIDPHSMRSRKRPLAVPRMDTRRSLSRTRRSLAASRRRCARCASAHHRRRLSVARGAHLHAAFRRRAVR